MSEQADFCATLVDEWVRRGARHAVVAPGSRNTPLALALAEHDSIHVEVFLDERSAAFCALGIGLRGVPAVLLCTSGTAAANFHPAVVEASLSAVPMLVVTADRPPELRDVGAPQTIVQTDLYGCSVRWFHDPGVAVEATRPSWRSLARRAYEATLGARGEPGPVHVNLPFREPLVGRAADLPRPFDRVATGAARVVDVDRVDALDDFGDLAGLDRQRGIIVAGGRGGVTIEQIGALAEATNWPVLADPCSGARRLESAVPAFDALLRHDGFARDHRPDIVIRVGRPPASRVLAEWIAATAPLVVQVGGPGVIDPGHDVAVCLPAAAMAPLTDELGGASGTPWLARWQHASRRAEEAIAADVARTARLTEPAVARTVAEHLPDGVELVVASSMPIRDLEWYGGHSARAHANRGANGIDGTMSTAVGLALASGVPVAVLLGDVAFLHDAGALAGLVRRGLDVRIVVVDNDGGGIFSFLPQATELAGERFEQLFGTPHGTDLAAIGIAHGVDSTTVITVSELAARLAIPGPSLTRVPTDRAANVTAHAALNAAVAKAVGEVGRG